MSQPIINRRTGLFLSVLTPCEKCGKPWTGGGVHATRWASREGRMVKVDCKGNVIPEEKTR